MSSPAGYCVSAPRGGPSNPRPSDRRSMWTPSRRTPSPWASARRAPARPTWRWPPPWRPSGTSRSTGSSSPARRWRPASGWAFCPETCRVRWTPICGRCTMPSLICWERRPTRSIWSGATSRWRLLPICVAGRWTTASSSWTRHRTPPGSR